MIKILHVEPDVGVRAFIKQRLEELNPELNIISVESATETISVHTRDNVDLILIHYSPSLNPIELTRTLKNTKNKPIMVYSTEGEESISNQLLEISADFCFVLRMSRDESQLLIKKIKKLVENGRRDEFYSATLDSDARAQVYEQRLRLLHEFAPKIINERNIDNLIDSTLNIIDGIFDSEVLSFLVVEGNELVCLDRRWKKRSIKFPLIEENILTHSVREGKSFTNKDFFNEELLKDDITIKSELSVPIKNKDVVVAVVDLRSIKTNNYNKDDIFIVEALARYIGCTYSIIAELQSITSSETQYHSLLESLGEAIYVFTDTQYVYVNEKGARLLGHKYPSEIIGRDISLHITPEYIRNLKEILEKSPDSQSSSIYEMKLIKTDNSTIEIDVFASTINFGGKSSYLIIEKDTTNFKLMQEQLKKYTSYLEAQVEKRSKELLEAQQFASAGKLASMVGHDLRNPLQSIKNATYLIQKQPERSEEMLTSINSSVDRALSMLEDLRYKTMETSLKIESIEINKLIRDILKETLLPENISVDTHLDSALKMVSIDSQKIRRVLDNLIKNAAEAMPNGGKLKIESINEGDNFVLSITDTGIGIPQDRLPNLFKPFYTTKSNGLGLGLAYSYKAIETHGGTIKVESAIGKGTNFRITLKKSQFPTTKGSNNK